MPAKKTDDLFFMADPSHAAAFKTYGKRAKKFIDNGSMDTLPIGSYNAVPFKVTTKLKKERTDKKTGRKLPVQNWLTIHGKVSQGEYAGRTITSNVNLFNEKSLAFLCQRLSELTEITISPDQKNAVEQLSKALAGLKGVECVFRKFENTKTLDSGEERTYINTVIDRTA
jgi:hypothetical protein